MTRPGKTATDSRRGAGLAVTAQPWTTKLEVPAAVGAPRMAPLAESRDRPAGSDPVVMDQVNGDLPPDACRSCEYAAPTDPSASVLVATCGSAWRVMVNEALCVCPEPSVTVKVTPYEPALPAAGVPESVALPAVKVRPGGSPPETLQL